MTQINKDPREVIIKPIVMAAIVLHALALAKRFADVNLAFRIDEKRHRVGERWFGGDELPGKTGRDLKTGQSALGLRAIGNVAADALDFGALAVAHGDFPPGNPACAGAGCNLLIVDPRAIG